MLVIDHHIPLRAGNVPFLMSAEASIELLVFRHRTARFPESNVTTTIQISSDPIELLPLPGFETTVFCGGSDVSFYTESGATCLMYGPGSLVHAHTDDEHIELSELGQAFEAYQNIYFILMQAERRSL